MEIIRKIHRIDWFPGLHPTEEAMVTHAVDTVFDQNGYAIKICHAEAWEEERYRNGFFGIVLADKVPFFTGTFRPGEDEQTYLAVKQEMGEALFTFLQKPKAVMR